MVSFLTTTDNEVTDSCTNISNTLIPWTHFHRTAKSWYFQQVLIEHWINESLLFSWLKYGLETKYSVATANNEGGFIFISFLNNKVSILNCNLRTKLCNIWELVPIPTILEICSAIKEPDDCLHHFWVLVYSFQMSFILRCETYVYLQPNTKIITY